MNAPHTVGANAADQPADRPVDRPTALLASLLAAGADAPPFAVIRREHEPTLDVLVGEVIDVDLLADIPLDGAEVLALVPFRQVRERGFEAHDDGAPIRCLVVRERVELPVADAIDALPRHPIAVDLDVDVSDEAYADIVRRVIDEEIGRGEGANFVIRREFVGGVDVAPAIAVLGWLRALLEHERGAFWTFAVHTPGLAAVGATPERHVSSIDGLVSMNPISGTFRHDVLTEADAAAVSLEDRLTAFLHDVKEREELVMVVDEELKMMSAVCPEGGRIRGPFLKRMSRLTHTEYLLEGHSDLDPREVLRRTMFAPTVTGSPMGNACSVIARHEPTARGYYAGVFARFTPTARGYDVDAPILIRTAYLRDGRVSVPVGATLVRHSDPVGEVAETRAKAAGMLTALGAIPRAELTTRPSPAETGPSGPASSAGPAVTGDAEPHADLLAARNDHLAAFWRAPQQAHASRGVSALVIDANDDFTTMLAHQLRHLGLDVRLVPWHEAPDAASDDLVVFGPGPGDPRDAGDPRIARMRELIAARLETGRPLLAVCLSHQVLADLAGLPLAPLATPRQGVQIPVDVFGERAAIGFYNTFSALAPDGSTTPELDLEVAADAATNVVHALRGPGVASVQGHLESVTSPDGLALLERLVDGVLTRAALVP
ncbi:phenazine biosynthesis protein phzE [Agromyces sp. CF514]|uniref:anthranilate synthase family protein n=1 Tax=Agromyces sp. CF514 TaxID=1881031 RepID=UPI0008E1B7E6|nr:chorismate-binding protein [Agromyces sp. CF514]SFR74201.1 phenazine biosynthesis protein phzE [Agromyces sp. CF514]